MSSITLPGTGAVVSTDLVGGEQVQVVKISNGAATVDGGLVTTANPFPVAGPLTNTELRASAVPVSGPLTNTELRATAVSVVEAPLLLTGAAAQTATVNNILESVAGASGTDISSFRSASVQVVSTGTGGTFIFEQSNDGTNWRPLPVFNSELATATPIIAAITATASQLIYTIPLRCRFLRLRIATTITGGSIQAHSRFSTESWTPSVASVAQATAANLNVTASGTVTANIGTGSLAAGTNAIGDVGLQFRANATGAASINHIVSAASTNAANIKATAGRVVGWNFVNTTASYQYVKLHNSATAPTAGAGVVMTIAIPPNGVNNMPVGGAGIGFSAGIGRTIVTGSADTDATATTAGAVVGDLHFA